MTAQAVAANPEAIVRVAREDGRYHLVVEGQEERLTSTKSWARKKSADQNADAVRHDIDTKGFDSLGGKDWERAPIERAAGRGQSEAPVGAEEYRDWRARSGSEPAPGAASPADRLLVHEQSAGSFEVVFPTRRDLLVHPETFPSLDAAQDAIDRIRDQTPPGAQVNTEGWRRTPRMRAERLDLTEIDGKTHLFYGGSRQYHIGPALDPDVARQVLLQKRSEITSGVQPDLRSGGWVARPRQDPTKLSLHDSPGGGAQVRYRTSAGYRHKSFESHEAAAGYLEQARERLESGDPARQIDFRRWDMERTRSRTDGPRYDHERTKVREISEGDFRIELCDQVNGRSIVSRQSFDSEPEAVEELARIYGSLGPQDALDTSPSGPFMDRRALDRELEIAKAPDPTYPGDLEAKLKELVSSNGDVGQRLEEAEASMGQFLATLRKEPTQEEARKLLGTFYRATSVQGMQDELKRLSSKVIPAALRDSPIGRTHAESIRNLKSQIADAPSEAKIFASISKQVSTLNVDPQTLLQDARSGKLGQLDFQITPKMEQLIQRTLGRNLELQGKLPALLVASEWNRRAPDSKLPEKLGEKLAGLARSKGTLRNLAPMAVAKPVGLALGATLTAVRAVDREIER